MNYLVEDTDIRNFKAWSGGKDWLDQAFENGTVDELSNYFEEIAENREEPLTETEINDILWFDEMAHEIIENKSVREKLDDFTRASEFSKEALDALAEYLEDEYKTSKEEIGDALDNLMEYDTIEDALDDYDAESIEELTNDVSSKVLDNGHVVIF